VPRRQRSPAARPGRRPTRPRERLHEFSYGVRATCFPRRLRPSRRPAVILYRSGPRTPENVKRQTGSGPPARAVGRAYFPRLVRRYFPPDRHNLPADDRVLFVRKPFKRAVLLQRGDRQPRATERQATLFFQNRQTTIRNRFIGRCD